MASKTHQLTDDLYRYLLAHSLQEHPAQEALRRKTATMEKANMQISPEQGQFMQLLVRLINARQVIEVGVFTGYSALSLALALPPEGRIIACDVSEEWTSIGRKYWEQAGIAHKIDLRLAPAADTLQQLLDQGQERQFDMAFIDADKENYDIYYEQCLSLLRPNGLMVIDNTLWEGKVADPDNRESETVAIRALNEKIYKDARVDLSLLPISDGVTLVRKKDVSREQGAGRQ